MGKIINWNAAEFELACIKVGMEQLEKAASVIAAEMKAILTSKITGMQKISGKDSTQYIPWPEHGSYEIGKDAGKVWTERKLRALVDTIRVVVKKDSNSRNVWIMAGNFKVWWAVQVEYGNGGWHGGRKSFMRPAMAKAPDIIQAILESGSGEAIGF